MMKSDRCIAKLNVMEYHFFFLFQDKIEASLLAVHQISSESRGSLCVSQRFRSLQVPIVTDMYDGTRQKADMAAALLRDVGVRDNRGKILYSPY